MSEKKTVILMGPQGSGKGTQAALLVQNLNFRLIETGSIFRKIAQENSKFGKKIKKLIDNGNLAPDDIAKEVVDDKFSQFKSFNIVIDGYPRNLLQVKDLDEILDKYNRKNVKVILVNISKQETIKRLSKRRVCGKCKKIFIYDGSNVCRECGGLLIIRDDDKPEAIKKRLEIYNNHTKPVLDFYKKKGWLVEVDGERTIEEVYQEIRKNLNL